MGTTYIICQKCKTNNVNSDYCISCGEIINIVLKRKKEEEEYKKKILLKNQQKKPSKLLIFINELRNHPNNLVRLFVNFFYSIGIIVIIFAAVVAAVIASLAG